MNNQPKKIAVPGKPGTAQNRHYAGRDEAVDRTASGVEHGNGVIMIGSPCLPIKQTEKYGLQLAAQWSVNNWFLPSIQYAANDLPAPIFEWPDS